MTLREQLIRDEGGYRKYAYLDSRGFTTIGFGRCIDRPVGKGVSLAEAEAMLDADIRDFTADVLVALPWAKSLDEVRRGVLVNMAMNMGVQGLLSFKKALASMRAGEWYQAAAHMMDSRWAKQVGIRAERLAEQMRSGEWQ